MIRKKNWIQLPLEIGLKRYADFLRRLWYEGMSGLNSLIVFRNIKSGKEILKLGKKKYKAKIKKRKGGY